MTRKTAVVFYSIPSVKSQGLTFETVDLVNDKGEKKGFLITQRVTENLKPPPSGFDFNPYNVTKSINLPEGVITFSYEVVNRLTVVCKPIYEAGFKNSVITREIISKKNSKTIEGKLTLVYDA